MQSCPPSPLLLIFLTPAASVAFGCVYMFLRFCAPRMAVSLICLAAILCLFRSPSLLHFCLFVWQCRVCFAETFRGRDARLEREGLSMALPLSLLPLSFPPSVHRAASSVVAGFLISPRLCYRAGVCECFVVCPLNTHPPFFRCASSATDHLLLVHSSSPRSLY